MEQHEVRVEHHVAGVFVLEHVGRVLRDARAYQVELAPLRPELREVADDRRVPEEALDLVDVEPGRHPALEVRVHAVANRLQGGEHAEHPHVLGEVLEVHVGDAVFEADVALVVEKRQRPLDVAFVAERYVARLGLFLVEQQLVEIAQHGQAALVLAAHVGELHAPADDGLVRLGQPLSPFRHGRARERQYRVDLEGELRLVCLVGDVGEVEGVHERVGVRREANAGPACGLHHRRIFSCGVEDDHLVVGIGQNRVHDFALDAEALARAGLAADEAHGARQLLSVADDEVARLLGLAVVAAALLVELLGGKRHLYGDLGGGHVAGHVHMVEPQRQDRVHALALPVRQRLDLDGALAGSRHDLAGLVVEGLRRVRISEHEPRVGEQALVLVLQLVEELFGLLLRMGELGREYREIVPFLHRTHLLVDDLFVHPGDALFHVGDGCRLSHGVNVQGDVQGHRQVDDVGDAIVLQIASEAAEDKHAAPGVVRPVAVRAPLGLEVEHGGRDQVLGSKPARVGQFVPRERGLGSRAQLGLEQRQALLPIERARLASDPRERLHAVAAGTREPGRSRIDVVRSHEEGEVSVAHEVGHPLAHLVVEDAVVLLDVSVDARVALLEEALAPDLSLGDGGVDDGELDRGLRSEVVVELAHSREDGLLVLLPRRLVADIAELDGLAEQPFLYLRGPVGVHCVVADCREHVFGLRACAPLSARSLLDPLFLLLQPRRSGVRAVGAPAALARLGFPRRGLLFALTWQDHRARPPSSSPSASPCATDSPAQERAERPRARGSSDRRPSGPRAGSRAKAGRTSPISCDRAARTPRAKTAWMRT